jgi:hypothetical protein
MSAEEDVRTIAEAAAELGVSGRTLYRLLKSDNFAGRTVTEHRQTVTGRRMTTVLPAGVVGDLKAYFEARETPAGNDDATVTDTGVNGDTLTPLYQRIIGEQAARIDDLKFQLAAADHRERELLDALRREQENIHRTQALRLIEGAGNAADSPQDAPEDTGAANHPPEAGKPAESPNTRHPIKQELTRRWWQVWRNNA